MQFRKYSKNQLIEAVKTSISIRETLIKLNVAPQGGNYRTIHSYIKKLNLDTSHFKGQGWNKGKKFPSKHPTKDYLNNKYKISSHALRLRLLKENYFQHKCYKCNLIEWNNKPIPLELEHIDGNHKNNNLSNLTLLCPNCHAQTDTYRGKNQKRKKQKNKPKSKNYSLNSKQNTRKANRLSYEQLKIDLQNSNYSAVGRKYGVSDNAVRKWIKHYEKYQ